MTYNWSSWKDYQNSSWSQWSSYGPPLPSSWKQDEAHHDSNLAHGYPLFRTIQPTAWSRKKGIHGLDPLELPVHQLCRYGLQEFSLRPLIAGRFLGLVCTRSVAESVFTAQLLKSMRENAVDVDIIADYLYQTNSSTTSIPSKNDQPVEFIAPLIHEVVTKLKALQPQKTEGQALRRVQALEAQLKAAQDQLAAAGLSDQPQSHASSPNPPPKRSPSSAHLGSTPKRKARKTEETTQQKLSKMFPPQEASAPSVPAAAEDVRRTPVCISDGDDDGSLLSVSKILDASSPVLKQYQPGGFSAATIKKWFQTFPTETQQPAKKIIQILNDSGVTKTNLQQAAIQYGLPTDMSLKMTPSTLHQIVAIGASLTA
jgi:hypothetical protein